MLYTQKDLPYTLQALVPFLSEEQMHYHYHKHHAGYVNKLNLLTEKQPHTPLKTLVQSSSGKIFNNAAQVWNHTFFWSCMSPNGGGMPKGDLLHAIESRFQKFDHFKKCFLDVANDHFGSGWVWLVKDVQGNLELLSLINADTPLKHGKVPILTLDVWEHAYYIDYRNERPRFVQQFFDVINWNFVMQCYQEGQDF